MTDLAPLVSIITPAYNASEFIGETIESVQAQSYTNWEMLITNDGSTDNTVEVVQSYADKDSRIRLLEFEENTGLAAKARNNSMQNAKGDYIAFLDADDLWVPKKLERQIDYLTGHADVDGVCAWFDVFGDEEECERWRKMNWRFNAGRVTRSQVVNTGITTSTILFRRRCFDEMGGMIESKDLVIAEDLEFMIRLVFRYNIHRIAEPLIHYRVNPQGESLSTKDQTLDRQQHALEYMARVLQEQGVFSEEDARRYSAVIHYNRARDALFVHQQPFRGPLWKSVRTGRAPLKAWIMFGLCFLPAPVLKRTLEFLLRLRNPG